MRLGIVTARVGHNDGQGRVNLEVAAEALRQGHEVVLFCEQVEEHEVTGGTRPVLVEPPAWLPSRLLKDQLFAWRSHRRIGAPENRCDVILANGFTTWHRSDVNAVHFVHDAWLSSRHHPWRQRKDARALYARIYNGLNAGLERRAFRRAGHLVAVSEKVCGELLNSGVPAARVTTITNGVDVDEFRPGAPARQRFGLPQGSLLAVFAGDLRSSRKNLDTVLLALRAVPDLHLAVAGRPNGSPYPGLARSLGLTGRVHFLGFVRDMPDLMRSADMFVFPSHYEPSGLVVLEAMASGLPVITTRRAGCTELVEAGGGIVLEDSEDASALVAAMSTLCRNNDCRWRMGHRARALVRPHTWPAMARRYLDLLLAAHATRLGAVGETRP